KEGIEIVLLDTVRDSSTQLLTKFQTGRNGKADLAAFESLVFSQRRVEATHYDESYWKDEWRQAGNVYTIEKRREIEGRHPQVVKDVFNPTRVLDVGCGPGILMYLLHEVGVSADGVDPAPGMADMAPAEVRDRISLGGADSKDIPSN